ncbi:MAG: hypothetical protein AAF615_05090 [Pseudomonadota bacterium]
MEQLALDLGTPIAPPNTVVSRSNEAVYRLLSAWPHWPNPVVLVSGPAGSGKSHAAATFAEAVGARLVEGAALERADILDVALAPVVVDDAHEASDRSLFHLINAVRSAGGTMILTAAARQVGGLADLDSRLRALPDVPLQAPDDALIEAVLRDSFSRRQLTADPAVVSFLMTRMERTLHSAVHLVDALDRLGLAEQRAPTRPLAARVLVAADGSR